jgi:hypothetical protein
MYAGKTSTTVTEEVEIELTSGDLNVFSGSRTFGSNYTIKSAKVTYVIKNGTRVSASTIASANASYSNYSYPSIDVTCRASSSSDNIAAAFVEYTAEKDFGHNTFCVLEDGSVYTSAL